MSAADWLRWVSIGEFALVAGWSVIVMAIASRFRQPPWYIRLVAASYIVFVGGWGWELHSRLGEPAGWRIALALFAGSLGLVAMAGMQQHYRLSARRRRHRAKSDRAARSLLAEAQRRKQKGDAP